MTDQCSHRRAKRSHQYHAFECDIDHTRPLAKHAAERRENQRGRYAEGRGDELPGHVSPRFFIQLHSPSAETDKIISACNTTDSSRVTCSVSRSKSAAPL